jgi:1-aminocyclopropane-1-carboxylate deaminase/D-cysteine desulfhydrase-like pyridoxal-dependent ACC family enzyme
MNAASSLPQAAAIDRVRCAIDRLPRLRMAHLPTPLEEAPRFAKALGGPRIFIKRDDCTGVAFGGNKARHNELVFGHARELGAEMFVWGAGTQSNNCRQTAAGCAKLGLACHLVLSRAGFSDELQGNLLIDHLVGATVEIVDPPVGPELDALIARRAEEFRAQGRRVYAWDREIVKPRAAVSYLLCLCEILEQLAERGEARQPAATYVCSAGSTGSGLALARAALGMEGPVKNIAPICWPWDLKQDMAEIANAAAELLGLDTRLAAEDIDATEEYVGPGYGIPTDECLEAMQLLARTEGVVLDPVYTGKALAALIADVRRGAYRPDDVVVFVHTGGTPAVFAYRDRLGL